MKPYSSPINPIFFWMIALSVVAAGFNGSVAAINETIFLSAKDAVVLCIGLIGPMALWLGVMKVAEAGGLTIVIARALRPVMKFLFPDLPIDHPATAAIIMNMAANMLGLGNAATPLGIKAMQELDKLNPEKGTATDSMALFLAINTSSIALLPLGVITIRATAGCSEPGSILIPSLLASSVATIVAIAGAKIMAKRNPFPSVVSEEEALRIEKIEDNAAEDKAHHKTPLWAIALIAFLAGSVLYTLVMETIVNHRLLDGSFSIDDIKALFPLFTTWLIPLLLLGLLLFGATRKVPVYEVLTSGAKDGFETAKNIIPFMVAIFVAIGMVRKSGLLDFLNQILSPVLTIIGMPTEAITMGLLRPLSGSGAFGFMSEIVSNDPNSFLADLVCVMQGSTETTFYVLAVYFGAIGVSRMRYALPVALVSDVVGILAALFFTRMFLG